MLVDLKSERIPLRQGVHHQAAEGTPGVPDRDPGTFRACEPDGHEEVP